MRKPGVEHSGTLRRVDLTTKKALNGRHPGSDAPSHLIAAQESRSSLRVAPVPASPSAGSGAVEVDANRALPHVVPGRGPSRVDEHRNGESGFGHDREVGAETGPAASVVVQVVVLSGVRVRPAPGASPRPAPRDRGPRHPGCRVSR